jgi:hypothetical protein
MSSRSTCLSEQVEEVAASRGCLGIDRKGAGTARGPEIIRDFPAPLRPCGPSPGRLTASHGRGDRAWVTLKAVALGWPARQAALESNRAPDESSRRHNVTAVLRERLEAARRAAEGALEAVNDVDAPAVLEIAEALRRGGDPSRGRRRPGARVPADDARQPLVQIHSHLASADARLAGARGPDAAYVYERRRRVPTHLPHVSRSCGGVVILTQQVGSCGQRDMFDLIPENCSVADEIRSCIAKTRPRRVEQHTTE